jgi:hypothetical protein
MIPKISSSQLFSTTAPQRASGPLDPSAPQPAAPTMADPMAEKAYLQFGRPILQALVGRNGRTARFFEIADALAAEDGGFDFDLARLAVDELVRRGAVELAERDPRRGDHLLRLTPSGVLLAA